MGSVWLEGRVPREALEAVLSSESVVAGDAIRAEATAWIWEGV